MARDANLVQSGDTMLCLAGPLQAADRELNVVNVSRANAALLFQVATTSHSDLPTATLVSFLRDGGANDSFLDPGAPVVGRRHLHPTPREQITGGRRGGAEYCGPPSECREGRARSPRRR